MPKTATPSATSQFVTVKEASELLRVSQVSIRRYLGQKKIRKFKVGARTLLHRDEVLKLVREA